VVSEQLSVKRRTGSDTEAVEGAEFTETEKELLLRNLAGREGGSTPLS
jgi:hypothetical protein